MPTSASDDQPTPTTDQLVAFAEDLLYCALLELRSQTFDARTAPEADLRALIADINDVADLCHNIPGYLSWGRDYEPSVFADGLRFRIAGLSPRQRQWVNPLLANRVPELVTETAAERHARTHPPSAAEPHRSRLPTLTAAVCLVLGLWAAVRRRH